MNSYRTLEVGDAETLQLQLRLDTERELEWYRHGGVLPQALRELM